MTNDERKELVQLLARARISIKTGKSDAAIVDVRQALMKLDPNRSIESELRGEKLRPYPERCGDTMRVRRQRKTE